MITDRIKAFNSFGIEERCELGVFTALAASSGHPLSGYLAGRRRGGHYVTALEDAWAQTFHVRHAIAVNSATSGLLAAAFAVGLGPGDHFVCPAMTMSATAAAPMFTGATPVFEDVSDQDFGLAIRNGMPETTKAIFTTNLFGQASRLARREWDRNCGTYLIEDNAQSPFAMANGRYAGTFGHIGVWSLNIHKPIQCGEGGIVTTDHDDLAARMRDFINHGETIGGPIGLNLRMPELSAVIALTQLQRGPGIIEGRVKQAQAILDAIGDIALIRKPKVQNGCSHVYYTIPFLIRERRKQFCDFLRSRRIPVVEGYVAPLYRLPAFSKFATACPTAEALHDHQLFYIENCAWDFTPDQIAQIGAAFQEAAEMNW